MRIAEALEEQHRRVEARLEAMYEDRLEGRITAELYDRKEQEVRGQNLELLRHINEIQANEPTAVQCAMT